MSSRSPLAGLALALSLSTPLHAEGPAVITDVAPVQGLVAMVMGDLGTPEVLIGPDLSPHALALRPSQARTLAQADLVVWIGPALTPWLDQSLETLATEARHLTLLGAGESLALPFRQQARFDLEDAHGHEETQGEAQGQDEEDGHGHGAGALDPHAWLDPRNALAWLPLIAEALTDLDPGNAGTYRANAAAAATRIIGAEAAATALLAPYAERPIVVFHDAWHYFEDRFGLRTVAAILLSDSSTPSAARLVEVRQAIRDTGATCVFAEPQFDPRLIASVVEDSPVRTAVLDPLGSRIPSGPGFYPALIEGLAADIAACLD